MGQLFSCMLFALMILDSGAGNPQELPSDTGRPQNRWAVGDSWRIRTRDTLGIPTPGGLDVLLPNQGPPYEITMWVSGIGSIHGEPCFMIDAVYPRSEIGIQSRYRAFYAKADGRLLCIENNTVRQDGSVIGDRKEVRGDKDAPPLGSITAGACFLLLPFWTERETPSPAEANPLAHRVVQSFEEDTKTGDLVYHLKRGNCEDRQATGLEEIIQVWKPGEKWYSECRESEKGVLIKEYILVNSETER